MPGVDGNTVLYHYLQKSLSVGDIWFSRMVVGRFHLVSHLRAGGELRYGVLASEATPSGAPPYFTESTAEPLNTVLLVLTCVSELGGGRMN